jgi:drug/metabolite transporter (DMT)-like permease
MPKLSERSGLVLAALAAILFSAKAILAKLMYRYGVDATTVIALRLAFAGPVFGVIAVIQHQRARVIGQTLSWRDVALVLLLGFLGYYLSSFLDFWGLQYIPAALERLILFLTPTLVAIISWVALEKTISRSQVQALVLSYLGILIVFWSTARVGLQASAAMATACTDLSFIQGLVCRIADARLILGCVLCFGAACSYAVYLVLSGELVKRLGSLRLVAYAMGVSTVLTALHYLLFSSQPLAHLPQEVYVLSAANALFCTIIPVYLTMFSVQIVGAPRTSQLSMLGPISLLFFGYFILHEVVTPVQIVGTVVVLLGVWRMISPGSPRASHPKAALDPKAPN